MAEVCEKKSVNPERLLDELTAVIHSTNDTPIDFASWPLDLLIDYIEKKHHRYVEGKIPVIKQYLDKLCEKHSGTYPQLIAIRDLFAGCANDLTMHLKKEELILFPYIGKLQQTAHAGKTMGNPSFGSIANPIAMMLHEHDQEGERFRKIARLTQNYTPPADACNTFRVTYSMLQDFEQDLHEHIHLENNILFPRAKKLEQLQHPQPAES